MHITSIFRKEIVKVFCLHLHLAKSVNKLAVNYSTNTRYRALYNLWE